MASDIPATMKALVLQEGRRAKVVDHPVPSIAEDEILVKVVAVALNPTDYKHIDNMPNPGTVVGCDLSGTVVRVGSRVTTFAVGDHVTAFVHGSTYADSGAFAEYVRLTADLAWVVPPGTLSHEEAATTSVGLWTAVQALYHPGRLGLVEPLAKVSKEEWVFVYGGSTAVGLFAVQLAHLSGYKVVSTASPRNFDIVKARGADVVFDYRDPEVVSKIKATTGDSIARALDTISLKDTQKLCADVIRPSGGKVVLLLAKIPSATTRKDVELQVTVLYTVFGRDFAFGSLKFAAVPEDRAHMASWMPRFPQLFKEGKVTPLPVKFWPGGLSAINDGLQYLRDGKVSAEKIVYRI